MFRTPPRLPGGSWLVRRTAQVLVPLGVSIGIGAAVVRPDLWMVERIVFQGHQRASVATLRHLADLPNGTAPWEVDAAEVARALETHPWVRQASVMVEWPHTVVVDLEEHELAGFLRHEQRTYAVDDTGWAFLDVTNQPQWNRQQSPRLPIIEGITPRVHGQHPALGRLAARDAIRLTDALHERALVDRSVVDRVVFSTATGFTVETVGVRLHVGPDRHEPQLDRLDQLVRQGLDLTERIDVDLAPSRVAVLRPRPFPAGGPSPAPLPPQASPENPHD